MRQILTYRNRNLVTHLFKDLIILLLKISSIAVTDNHKCKTCFVIDCCKIKSQNVTLQGIRRQSVISKSVLRARRTDISDV